MNRPTEEFASLSGTTDLLNQEAWEIVAEKLDWLHPPAQRNRPRGQVALRYFLFQYRDSLDLEGALADTFKMFAPWNEEQLARLKRNNLI